MLYGSSSSPAGGCLPLGPSRVLFFFITCRRWPATRALASETAEAGGGAADEQAGATGQHAHHDDEDKHDRVGPARATRGPNVVKPARKQRVLISLRIPRIVCLTSGQDSNFNTKYSSETMASSVRIILTESYVDSFYLLSAPQRSVLF